MVVVSVLVVVVVVVDVVVAVVVVGALVGGSVGMGGASARAAAAAPLPKRTTVASAAISFWRAMGRDYRRSSARRSPVLWSVRRQKTLQSSRRREDNRAR
jgi:hypothetical protein